MEAHGHNGQVYFDGQFVTIARRGFLARSTVGKGEKRLPLHTITAVQWKPATRLVNGFIQFTVPGGVEVRSRVGRQTIDAGHDENSVVFTHKQMPAFVQLRAEIEAALARTHGPVAVPLAATKPAERLRELSGLHDSGLISDEEYETKRAEILRKI